MILVDLGSIMRQYDWNRKIKMRNLERFNPFKRKISEVEESSAKEKDQLITDNQTITIDGEEIHFQFTDLADNNQRQTLLKQIPEHKKPNQFLTLLSERGWVIIQ